MKTLLTFILIFLGTAAFAETSINATVIRNSAGSGDVLISSGFPFPTGLVTEQTVQDGKIRVLVGESEVAANVSALRGRHADGSVRSVLIQFTISLSQNATASARVVVGGAARTLADPTYVRPTLSTVQDNNVIVATDEGYLCSTFVTLQNLLPAGVGSAPEEKQYTTLAEDRFDALVASPNPGTADYEQVRGMVAMWQRTGDYKFHKEAVKHTLAWLPYNTPSGICSGYDVINPDGRDGENGSCGMPAEWHYSRVLSYASMYLLTGYRDFWGIVNYEMQFQHAKFPTQVSANSGMTSTYYPRFSYAFHYAAIYPAYILSATLPTATIATGGRAVNFEDQFGFVIGSLQYNAWDILWIPFNSGSGTRPPAGTTISQGGVSATFLAVSNSTGLPVSSEMISSGYIQIKKSSIAGGSFSAGALTGINATATGPAVDDYRNGLLGMKSNSGHADPPGSIGGPPVFQAIFPLNYLIDQYLYVSADSRIPAMVEAHTNIVLQSFFEVPTEDYGTWGVLTHKHPYNLNNPIPATGSPWTIPEYARAIAFLIKTVGDKVVHGKPYSQWYEICVNTANNAPQHLTWQTKLWGQYYGMNMDAPWIMAQSSLPAPTFVAPTQYATMIGETPEVYRLGGDSPEDPTPTASGPILRTGSSLLRVGGGVLSVQ